MSALTADLSPPSLLALVGVSLFAGFVKGAVGFGMPMIMISSLGSFLPAETALAALILPTLVTNLIQSFRQGWRAAWQVLARFRVYVGVMLLCLGASALLAARAPQPVLFVVIGVPILVFALAQLVGFRLHLDPARRPLHELLFGTVSGLVGGVSGVWGPPLIAYLTAIEVEKRESIRAQGVVFGLGSIALLVAHLRSGILNAETLPLSLAALGPTLLGLWVGFRLHDRMPQATFRRAVLAVLALAGLNLIRRGLTL
ncbi:MAG: sulfite exporter TauE/SafE family protein [Alphaproteobacteria bacterium]|nr:MAG: sulfite exporter TauE/SafE family protein [Alphaproteobacteria bacterium]